jgi:hypothetical protein
MEDGVKLQELQNLMLLVNTISSPTRFTKKSFTLKDTILMNKQAYKCSSTVLDWVTQIIWHKWNTHIQSLCSKLSKIFYIIKSLRGVLSPNMLRSIYFGKFQSLLRYGIIFGGVKVIVQRYLKCRRGCCE